MEHISNVDQKYILGIFVAQHSTDAKNGKMRQKPVRTNSRLSEEQNANKS